MKLRFSTYALLALVAGVSLFGCRQGAQEAIETLNTRPTKAAKIGVIVKDKDHPWMQLVLADAEKAAQELKSTLQIEVANDEASLTTALTNLTAADVDGILADVPEDLGEALRDGAEVDKLPVVTFETRPKVSIFLGQKEVKKLLDAKFIGFEDDDIGTTVAMQLVEAMTKKGWQPGAVSAVIAGGSDTPRAIAQANGAREALIASGVSGTKITSGSTVPAGMVLVIALNEQVAEQMAPTLSPENALMASVIKGANADSFKNSTSPAYVGTLWLNPAKLAKDAVQAIHDKISDKGNKDTMPIFDPGEWITK